METVMASGSSMNPFKMTVFLIVLLVGKIVSGKFAFWWCLFAFLLMGRNNSFAGFGFFGRI